MSTYLTLLTALRPGSEQAEGVQGLGGEHAKDAEAGNGDAQDHAHGGKEDAAHPHSHEGVEGEVQEVAWEGGQIPPMDVREAMPGEHEGRGDGREECREGIREAVAHAGDDGLLGTRGGAEEHRGVHDGADGKLRMEELKRGNCLNDVCALAKATGVCCADDECDLASGLRTLTPEQFLREWLGEPVIVEDGANE